MQSWQEPRLPTLLPVQKRGWDLLSSPNLSHVLSHTDVIAITIVDSYAISHLQGIFHTQELNPGLLHCRWIFYQLNHKGSPRTLGSLSHLQGIFPIQEPNQGLLQYRPILYQLSYKESPSPTRWTSVWWHHQLDGHEFEQAPGVSDEQGSLACCSPWGHKESDTTDHGIELNWCHLANSMLLIQRTSCTKPTYLKMFYSRFVKSHSVNHPMRINWSLHLNIHNALLFGNILMLITWKIIFFQPNLLLFWIFVSYLHMDRGAWWDTVHGGDAESQTQLSD